MIQINLLPVKTRKRRESANQFLSLYLVSVVALVGGIAYLWINQNNEIEVLTGRLTKLQAETKQYAKYETMLKEIQTQKQSMDKKRDVIQNLQLDRDAVVRVMALLSIQVPEERMWFEKLTGTTNSITLEGMALNNEAIVEFMRNLESSPYIVKGSVNLVHSRQTLYRGTKLREFQIAYRFFPFSEVQKEIAKTQGS